MFQELITAIRNADVYSLIAIILTSAVLLLICLPSHEFAHAFAAHKLGDDTAKYQGRLTLNPVKHLDIVGTIMILLIGVGYAKPVPVNMMNFKNRKRDMAITAVAGPLMNLFVGIIFIFLNVVFAKFVYLPYFTNHIYDYNNQTIIYHILTIIMFVLSTTAEISVSLAIFNLIPIPPFDGSRILGYFLPDRIYYKIMQYEQVIFIVVLALLWLGFLSGPLNTLMNAVYDGLFWLISLPFGGMN